MAVIKKFSSKLNVENLKKELIEENKNIIDLLALFDVPDTVEEDDDLVELSAAGKESWEEQQRNIKNHRKEGQEEYIKVIKGLKARKSKNRKPKKKKMKSQTEKVLSKSVKMKIKEEKNSLLKQIKQEPDKIPVFNEEGKIVFSKFDVAATHQKGKKSRREKVVRNPKDALKQIKKQRKEMARLADQGDQSKVKKMKEELTWKKAFDKIEGRKVKDDSTLLQKAIKRKKDKKLKSKQKWQDRKQKVEHDIEQRQKKRQENINKKIQDKKKNKLKRLEKRGRVILHN